MIRTPFSILSEETRLSVWAYQGFIRLRNIRSVSLSVAARYRRVSSFSDVSREPSGRTKENPLPAAVHASGNAVFFSGAAGTFRARIICSSDTILPVMQSFAVTMTEQFPSITLPSDTEICALLNGFTSALRVSSVPSFQRKVSSYRLPSEKAVVLNTSNSAPDTCVTRIGR